MDNSTEITANTITDTQIRLVVTDLYKVAPGTGMFIRNMLCDLTESALRGDPAARARCAEMLNHRTVRAAAAQEEKIS